MNKKIEAILFTLLFLGTIWLWALPFQKNHMPYGDVDSSTHFGLADYMAHSDKSMYYLPYFFNKTYYSKLNNGKIWYMPQIHTSAAIMQIISGDRILPIFLFWALICSSMVFTSYFLVRKLYGPMHGFAAAALLIFSMRDIMWYLWGQYLQGLSFALVPLVVYFYYAYLESAREKHKPVYLYLTALLITCQFFIHPQAILMSVLVSGIYTLFFILRHKIFPFRIREILIFLFILVLVLFPFIKAISSGGAIYNVGLGFKTEQIGTLFQWYPAQVPGGVPPSYYSYSNMHGKWTIPFILAGIIFLAIRRKNRDLLMLSLLIAFYLSMHQSLIGLGRAERFMQAEAMMIYPLVVLGFFSLASLIKARQSYIKYALFIIFILFIVSFNGKHAYEQLSRAYPGITDSPPGILRISPYQYAATEWMMENLPENAEVFTTGTAVFSTKKWMQALSYRHMDWDSKLPWNNTYALIDYSDMTLLGMKTEIEALQQWEKENLANSTLLYNKDYIRVYKLG